MILTEVVETIDSARAGSFRAVGVGPDQDGVNSSTILRNEDGEICQTAQEVVIFPTCWKICGNSKDMVTRKAQPDSSEPLMGIFQAEYNRGETFMPQYRCSMPDVVRTAQFIFSRGKLIWGGYLDRVILKLVIERTFLGVRNPYLLEKH